MSSFSPFVAALHVFLGGGVGAVLRWQLGRAMTSWLGAPIISVFPFATLAANAAGSLFMGLLAGWLARHGSGGSEQLRLLLGVGLLGGFTTFSAFSLETMLMIDRGQTMTALGYALASVAGAVGALGLGLTLMRNVAA